MVDHKGNTPQSPILALLQYHWNHAKENRYVAVADIPGAFLHADMDEEIYMLLEGKIAELIIKLDPKLYRKYI